MTSKNIEFKMTTDRLGNKSLVGLVDGQEIQRICLPSKEEVVIEAIADLIERNTQIRPSSTVLRHSDGRKFQASATLLYGNRQYVGLGEDEDYRIARIKAYIDGVGEMLKENV